MIDNPRVVIKGIPSKEFAEKLSSFEKERIEKQRLELKLKEFENVDRLPSNQFQNK